MRGWFAVLIAGSVILASRTAAAQPATGPDAPTETPAPADAAGPARPVPPGAQSPSMRPQNVVVEHRPVGEIPIIGPRLAPVTVEFFMALGNSQSQQLHERLMQLQRRHPRRLRILYRLVAAERYRMLGEAAMEAYAQERFEAFMAELLGSSRQPRTSAEIAEMCSRAGVRFEGVEAAWQDGRHTLVLERNDAERQRRSEEAVPDILINGVHAGRAGRLTIDELELQYQTAYEEAQLLLDRGVPLEHLYEAVLREHKLAAKPVQLTSIGPVDGTPPVHDPTRPPPTPLLVQNVDVPGHGIGPERAPVVVRFYCNFLSSNCALAKRTLDSLRKEFPTEVRLVFHHMFPDLGDEPLVAERYRELVRMHQAALCADEQHVFWDFYEVTYRDYLSRRHRQLDAGGQIHEITTGLELNPQRFQACMARPDGAEAVLARVRAARKAGVRHTPTLVIGGRIYPGVKSSTELRRLVEQELVPGLLEQLAPAWHDTPADDPPSD